MNILTNNNSGKLNFVAVINVFITAYEDLFDIKVFIHLKFFEIKNHF